MEPIENGDVYAQVFGGLGNQLFIISTAIAYSTKYNKRLCCFFNPAEPQSCTRVYKTDIK